MKIKISFVVLLLPFFITAGCDSEQKPPAGKNAETISTAPAATEVAAPTAAQESAAENKTVEPVAEPVQKAALSGEQVYKKSCVNCHGAGVANSPKLGDAAAWAHRIAKGNDALYNSAKKGVAGTAMMARGTCGACSDEELEAAVDFMVSGSK
ncbi:MAG: c-type cytochrome [Gammaproteobacteria bacterium]|nr:c-type cytochrome [Gammaproteobacteria bacterium]